MKLLPTIGLCVIAGCLPARAQLEGQAFDLARKSGVTIGAATACGLAADRALATGQRIMALVSAGPNALIEQQLRDAHVEAVAMGDRAQQSKDRPSCKAALATFRKLEDMTTIQR